MSLIPYSLTRPILFGMDPEAAHDFTMNWLARGQNTPLQCAWSQPMVSDPIELAETHPDRDPERINFVDLMNLVLALPGFTDEANRCGEKILEAIQQAWIDEAD